MHFEVAEVIKKPISNLSVPRIIPQASLYDSGRYLQCPPCDVREKKAVLNVAKSPTDSIHRRSMPCSTLSLADSNQLPKSGNYLIPKVELLHAKRRKGSNETRSSDASSRTPSIIEDYESPPESSPTEVEKQDRSTEVAVEDFDVQSVINERRPTKLQGRVSINSAKSPGHTQAHDYGHLYLKEDTGSADVKIYVDETDSQSSDGRAQAQRPKSPDSTDGSSSKS